MSDSNADRNLLVGMLALQLNFVTREQLIAATTQWSRDKRMTLVNVLEASSVLSAEEATLLSGLVDVHLARHDNDPLQSLASFDSSGQVRDVVDAAGDPSLKESIAHLPPCTQRDDPFATYNQSPDDQFATSAPTIGKHDLETPSYAAVPEKGSSGGSKGDAAAADAPDEAPLSLAAALRYAVIRPFQRGGLGQVSVARDEELKREVALKEILPRHADNDEARQRFLIEAEITGSLEHPGVVPVYGLGQYADGRPFYAMRFIRGDNLQLAINQFHRGQRTADRQLRFRQLLRRFVDVCNAIEYAHNRCVLHRDLKPGNIMLGKYGETLVVDWGLAKSIGPDVTPTDTVELPVRPELAGDSTETQMGRIVGTPAYMSPEQASGRVDLLGPATDIYSLGATLYHLLAGQAPFRSRDRDTLIGNVQIGHFDKPRDIQPEVAKPLEAICLKAMATKPCDRYLSARALADDIERYLADEPVQAYAEPWAARMWRWMRQRRALVLSTLAALTVTAVAATIGVIWLNAANIREMKLRQEAQQNFETARNAVRDYFISVSEDTLLNQPGMQPLRDQLLQQALAYYQHFLESGREHEELQDELAQAMFYVGRITELVESPASAIDYYERSAALYQQLVEEAPASAERLDALGDVLNAAGKAMQRQQSWDEARQYYQQAERPRRMLASAYPQNSEYARTLANTLMNLGTIAIVTGDEAAGVDLWEQAQQLRLARVSAGDVQLELQRDVGLGHFNLGLMKLNQNDVAAADPLMRQAMAVFEQVIREAPNDLNSQQRLATVYRTLGDIRSSQEGIGAAQPYYDRAFELFRALSIRSPEVPTFKSDLASLQLSVADMFIKADQREQALQAVLKAIDPLRELTQLDAGNPQYERNLGVALVIVGESRAVLGKREQAQQDLEQAIAVLGDLAARYPGDEDYAEHLERAQQAQQEVNDAADDEQ